MFRIDELVFGKYDDSHYEVGKPIRLASEIRNKFMIRSIDRKSILFI
jgi:hypothetical protein